MPVRDKVDNATFSVQLFLDSDYTILEHITPALISVHTGTAKELL